MNEEPDIDGSMPGEESDEERQARRESEPAVRRNNARIEAGRAGTAGAACFA